MTVHNGGTFWTTFFPWNLPNIFTNTDICDEFLPTVFNVCHGLVLSIMNLRLSYANHELLYTSSLAVKKSTLLISKLIFYGHVIPWSLETKKE
jgi:hypothetical protein